MTTPAAVEVPRAVGRLRVIGVVMLALAVVCLVGVPVSVLLDGPGSAVSSGIGAALLGAAGWWWLRRVAAAGPALVVDEKGFTDATGLGVEPLVVPWSQVLEVAVARPWSRFGRQPQVRVRLRDRDRLIGNGVRRVVSDTLHAQTGFDHAVLTRFTAVGPEELAELFERFRGPTGGMVNSG